MISIIVPIYQVEDYIQECLDSLIQQTYKDIEIICVNDCTLDNSITLVKEYQKKDSRIRIINHEENRGLGGARNSGIKAAKGEYILFVDSDDYTNINMIDKLYQSLITTKSDASVCGVMLTYPDGKTLVPHTGFHYDALADSCIYNIKESKEILTNMWPSAWNKLFKVSIIRENNILFKERILYEDHTFFYEYFSYCNQFAYIKEPLYYYRQQRPCSITTQSNGREKEIFTILEYISDIFKNIYLGKQYDELFMKIAIRLLYERRWVFSENDPNYYIYLHKVSDYLSKWEKNRLLDSKDSFILENDPIFYTPAEIDIYEKKELAFRLKEKKYIVKRILKKLPLVKQVVSFYNKGIALKNDFYWYSFNIYENGKSLNEYIRNKLGESSEVTLDSKPEIDSIQELSAKLDKMQDQFKTYEDKLNQQILKQDTADNHLEAYFIGIERLLNELKTNFNSTDIFEERLSNIEASFNSFKKKIDDMWWLSWNLKDRLEENGNSSFLRYYPTWIPCEYPEYFKGNTWYWSDNFKAYYIDHQGNCESDLQELFKGFSINDIEYIKSLWKRNTQIIPYAESTEEQGFLIKKDFIFTSEELKKQDEIVRNYTNITSNYILPEDVVYEIPVFFYEHGLKNMSEDMLNFVRSGDILDLGGFIGDSALILSKYTDQSVYTVEMNQVNINKMHTVLKTNHVENQVKIIWGAVGDKDTTQPYYGDSSYSTLNDLPFEELYSKKEEVPVHKVDTLVNQYGIIPHFIKLDVEGAEYRTIKGSKETITKFRPILCISIYHTATDFLKIKPLIASWNLNYRFHIENHNPFDPVYEKMLICIPE